jgi:hypothetical protein
MYTDCSLIVVCVNQIPAASLQLEHVYGYEGIRNYSNNLYFTVDPDEVVWYTAALGVVMNLKTRKQRFFFGHNDNIKSMHMHPCDWIVATGQTRSTGPTEVPYVCIWETRTCKRLQRLDHPFAVRAIGADLP